MVNAELWDPEINKNFLYVIIINLWWVQVRRISGDYTVMTDNPDFRYAVGKDADNLLEARKICLTGNSKR